MNVATNGGVLDDRDITNYGEVVQLLWGNFYGGALRVVTVYIAK